MTETNAVVPATVDQVPEPGFNPGYWHELIDEKLAADFLDVTPRFLQGRRQRGDGPRFARADHDRAARATTSAARIAARRSQTAFHLRPPPGRETIELPCENLCGKRMPE